MAKLSVDVLSTSDLDGLKFSMTDNRDWTAIVRRGGVVVFDVTDPDQRQSIRWRINGALRSRGIKASVRYAVTETGMPVYVAVGRA